VLKKGLPILPIVLPWGGDGGCDARRRRDLWQSFELCSDKARSAALFRRPTKVFEDALSEGRTVILALHGAMPFEGAMPLVADGKVVGAIGASGGTAAQDGQVAKAGADTVK
jgi:glc operon protein GlcG